VRNSLVPGRLPISRAASGADAQSHEVRRVAIAVALCALICCATTGAAKKKKPISKTISGVVLDGSENPIAGATVELTDKYTSKKVAIYTQESGQYQFTDLNPNHDYELQAQSQSKFSELRKVSSLDDRDNIVVNLRIPSSPP
jgi:hypothetical protein